MSDLMTRPPLSNAFRAVALFALLSVLPQITSAGIPGIGGLRVLFEADSIYHHIVVAEDADARYLRFDRSYQSGMYLRDTFDSPFLYAAYAHLGLIFQPEPRRVLVVGLGGGSVPKRFWRDYPGAVVAVAEIDPMVVDVAKRYFYLPDSPRLRIAVQDGRQFLRQTRNQYNIIFLDAYFAESIPFHLTTKEFLQLAKSRLAPGGVIVSNIIGALEGPRSALFRAMYKTFAEVFPGLYPFPTAFRGWDDPETLRNILLIASDERGVPGNEILSRARRLSPRMTFSQFLSYAADYYEGTIVTNDVPILTDDYAPVDSLLSVTRWTPPQKP